MSWPSYGAFFNTVVILKNIYIVLIVCITVKVRVLVVKNIKKYFSYIVEVSFIGRGKIALQLDLQLPMQSVSTTTNVVSSTPANGEIYSIPHYVIYICNKVCHWLMQECCFTSGSSVFLHQQNWLPRYNWNIVERGAKHHNHTLCNNAHLTWNNQRRLSAVKLPVS